MKNVNLAYANSIYNASKNNNLVIIVGAGISRNSGVPVWNDLVLEMKKDLPESIKYEHDALKIAQLYKNTFGHKLTIDKVKTVLKYGKCIPNKIHKAIFDLNPCHIITTNYDDLLEKFDSELIGSHFSTIRRDQDIPYALYNKYIIKMHGDFIDNNIVLSEDDYLNYFNNFPLISSLVQSLFATKTILCVGYSFSDPDLKMLLNTVKCVLKENTNRVYMLADYSNDSVYERYLQMQGIYPIWLDRDYLDESKSEVDSLPKQGRDVYNQLITLKRDLTIPNNIIDNLYDIFSKITPEIPYLIFGMKYLIPKEYFSFFNIYSRGLQLLSNQVDAIAEQIKTKKGLRQIIKGRVDKVNYLLDVACKNEIYDFDKLNLYKTARFKRYFKKKKYDAIDFIYEFDYENANKRMNEIIDKPIEYNSTDLELPFAYWSLGQYTKAFKKYNQLSEAYRKSSNHILYFLCLFSQRMLANVTRNESQDDSDIKKDLDNIRNLNFNKLIANLNISDNLKSLFNDIANFHMYLDVLADTKELEQKLIKDKKRADIGGWSSHDMIPNLISKIHRVFNFSNANYVITANNKYSNEVFKSGIRGLLISHITKETKFHDIFIQSRLEEVDKDLLLLMIFCVDTKTLSEIFRFDVTEQILLSQDAVSYIETCINNIDENSKGNLFNKSKIRKYIDDYLFETRFTNLMLVINNATNLIGNIDLIVNILIKNDLSNWRTDIHMSVLKELIEKRRIKITDVQANEIFNLYKVEDWSKSLFNAISNYMKENKFYLKLDKISLFNSPDLIETSLFIANNLYPIVSVNNQESIKNWILSSNFEKYDEVCWLLFWLIASTHCGELLNSHNIESYINFRNENGDKDSEYSIDLARISSLVAKKINDDELSTRMNQINDTLYQFFLNPNSVENSKIKPEWIYYLSNDDIKSFVLNQNHDELINNILEKNTPESNIFSKKLNKILLDIKEKNDEC